MQTLKIFFLYENEKFNRFVKVGDGNPIRIVELLVFVVFVELVS